MHLAYLDDSDTKAKTFKWQVMSGVIVEDKKFKLIEIGMASIQELLVPIEKQSQFEEFHACELYGGYGVFEGIEQEKRFNAIRRLLEIIATGELSVIYGAVNLDRLQSEVYASADPLDISFRVCIEGIHRWADKHMTELMFEGRKSIIPQSEIQALMPRFVDCWFGQLVLLIMDECDKKIKDTLHKSFQSVRLPFTFQGGSLPFHDDMYFGDSRYSVGIQLADLCSYFIARHLGGDKEIESFYAMIQPYIAFSEIHPSGPQSANAITESAQSKELTNGE
ncbi:MAG: DUF3800 domain-containing protein [Terriglobia bacterium]